MGKQMLPLLLFLCTLGCVGCSTKPTTDTDYLRCNKTSNGCMSEIESGYSYTT